LPRLFTGLEIPEGVAIALASLRGGLPGARWVEPQNYHVTLSFIGEVDGGVAREVAQALDEIEAAPVTIRFTRLDGFGGARPRTLIAAIERTPELQALQAAGERALARAGVETEGRRYTPHVTLARLRGTRAEELARSIAETPSVEGITFDARRFVLYSARPGGGGPYVVEQAYPLGGESEDEEEWND
jgi:2'-5' RNA ligase